MTRSARIWGSDGGVGVGWEGGQEREGSRVGGDLKGGSSMWPEHRRNRRIGG